MAIYMSTDRFPASAEVKDEAGLPWGAVIHPLSPVLPFHTSKTRYKDIPRCSSCFGYINPHATFIQRTWRCPLCTTTNKSPPHLTYANDRPKCVDVTQERVEYIIADSEWLDDPERAADLGEAPGFSLEFPAYIFVVDLSGSDEYIEVIKSSLQASLEALNPEGWVGLAVFSDRLGVYDMRCPTPHVKYCRIPRAAKGCPLALGDMLALDEFLVPVRSCKDNVVAAIESLSSHAPRQRQNEAPKVPLPKLARGFGATLVALIDLMSSADFRVNARLLTFLSGRPNMGLGALPDRYGTGKGRDSEDTLLKGHSTFYSEQAKRACDAGMCLDLYVLPDLEYVDLASLKYLSLMTGGNMVLYDTVEEATLPQDLFRQLQSTHAFQCLMRLRTSSEFQVSTVYGHLSADPRYDTLYHLGSCDARKVFAVDFEFTNANGFSGYLKYRPVMQLAFECTTLERVEVRDADANSEEGEGDSTSSEDESIGEGRQGRRPRWKMVRKLRVHTIKTDVASSPRVVLDHTRFNVIISLLTQGVVQATLCEGVQEARMLIRDWLINFFVCYNKVTSTSLEQPDMTLERATACVSAPRLIFSMLKHKLLSRDHVHPDQRVHLHCLFSALESTFLAKALYPSLSSYSDADTMVKSLTYLTRASLPEANIFVLDTLSAACVYYTAAAADLPCPPPYNTAIRDAIKSIKELTPLLSPRVVYCREGSSEARFFLQHLLEDHECMGFSFDEFTASVRKDLREQLHLPPESEGIEQPGLVAS